MIATIATIFNTMIAAIVAIVAIVWKPGLSVTGKSEMLMFGKRIQNGVFQKGSPCFRKRFELLTLTELF